MTALLPPPAIAFPRGAIAVGTEPAERRGLPRDRVRLLLSSPEGVRHHRFADLQGLLRPGDLLLVNNSATVPAELDATLDDGSAVVLHLAAELDRVSPAVPGSERWVIEVRTAPDAARSVLDATADARIHIPGWGSLDLIEPYPHGGWSLTGHGNRLWLAAGHGRGRLAAHRDSWGRPIAYGYLHGRFPIEDYQTVFGRFPGSAEMPSAARPFTERLVTGLVSTGVRFGPITLHTGVSSQEAGEAPQPEWLDVPAATAVLVNTTRAAGGRVVAVGTTATRAIESAVESGGLVAAARGWTTRVITPERPPEVVNGLITGWHDADASHLLLVQAVAGREVTQAAYTAAVEQGYLWHEFGDSALLLR